VYIYSVAFHFDQSFCAGCDDDKKLKVDFKSISCKVCNAPSSGFHFGAITCEGCKVHLLTFTSALSVTVVLLFFWDAPLGVHSAIHRHQPAQRTVLGQVDCFVQCEVVGSQIELDGVQPRGTWTPWRSLPFIWKLGGAVRIICGTKVQQLLRWVTMAKMLILEL